MISFGQFDMSRNESCLELLNWCVRSNIAAPHQKSSGDATSYTICRLINSINENAPEPLLIDCIRDLQKYMLINSYITA